MPDLIGELDPDPHFPLEVVPGSGEWTCAVPACRRHRYPRVDRPVAASFLGGPRPGVGQLVNPPPSVVRGRTEYVLGAYEKTPTGPGAVYHPAEEMP